MAKKLHIFGVWSGMCYLLLITIGWWFLAGFLPPHAPTADGAMIAQIYSEHIVLIRLGLIITMFAAMMYLPFAAVAAVCIKDVEGEAGILTLLQVMGGICTALLTFYPQLWWLAASFRLDRNPELIQLLSDSAWLQFVGGLSLGLPCMVTVALASFMDKRADPMFPRWLGYVTLWCLVLVLPDQLVFFFYEGPFAWDGIIGFWLPAIVFFSWFVLLAFILRGAIKKLPS